MSAFKNHISLSTAVKSYTTIIISNSKDSDLIFVMFFFLLVLSTAPVSHRLSQTIWLVFAGTCLSGFAHLCRHV